MLENEENRACGCGCNQNLHHHHNQECGCMNDNLPCEENTKSCEERKNEQQEMLCKIQQLDFAIKELALYLDTHPYAQRALCLHKEYCRQCKPLKEMYQKVYGPLTIHYPCNKWRWLEEPWPWEGGM